MAFNWTRDSLMIHLHPDIYQPAMSTGQSLQNKRRLTISEDDKINEITASAAWLS